jgi:hypothetical protein
MLTTIQGVCESSGTLFDGTCFNYSPSQIAAFPPMQLTLDGVTLNMTAADYIGMDYKYRSRHSPVQAVLPSITHLRLDTHTQ